MTIHVTVASFIKPLIYELLLENAPLLTIDFEITGIERGIYEFKVNSRDDIVLTKESVNIELDNPFCGKKS